MNKKIIQENLLKAGTIIKKNVKKNNSNKLLGPVSPVSPSPLTCFLANSLVLMANGQQKAIQEIEVGEFVVGAFGEINQVLALDRTILGPRYMYRINNEHSTTAEHPHVGINKKFYAQSPEDTYGEYGIEYSCLVEDGDLKTLVLHGIKPGLVSSLGIGQELQTSNGGKIVETIEKYTMSSSTLLFNLVLSGSHTYFVDGYAVGGWLRDDDFDYETWQKLDVSKVTIDSYNLSRSKELNIV